MKVLITGYPGFLGAGIRRYFVSQGAEVDTLSRTMVARSENTTHFAVDLASEVPSISRTYDIVIHAAGRAHLIAHSEHNSRKFIDSNITGTKNLLSALAKYPPNSLLFISSVAVYGRQEGDRIDEGADLNASDPYGLSKIRAEELILHTKLEGDVIRGIVRLPLIVGPEPPGNLGAMLRAMQNGVYFNIGKGDARRSVISRSDIAPFLSQLAKVGGVYNLTDGRDITFAELFRGIVTLTSCPNRPSIPLWVARPMAELGEFIQTITKRSSPFNRHRLHQMTKSLTFDSSTAQRDFCFFPRIVVDHLEDLFNTVQ